MNFFTETVTKIPKEAMNRIWDRVRLSYRWGAGGFGKKSERDKERVENGLEPYTNEEYQKLFGHECTIDKEYLQKLYITQNAECAMSGVPLNWKYNLLSEHPLSISVDRIDSSKGYIPGNVQLVLLMFNLGKNKTTIQEWKIVEDLIFNKLKS